MIQHRNVAIKGFFAQIYFKSGDNFILMDCFFLYQKFENKKAGY